jgi:hypothetical protein
VGEGGRFAARGLRRVVPLRVVRETRRERVEVGRSAFAAAVGCYAARRRVCVSSESPGGLCLVGQPGMDVAETGTKTV